MGDLSADGDFGPVHPGQDGVGFLVNQAARAIRAQMDVDLRLHNLSHGGFVLLRNVLRDSETSPDGVRVVDISRKLNIPIGSLAEQAASLERDGWMKMGGAGEDAWMLPTRKALNVLPVLVDASHWALERALNEFSRDDIDTLTELLRRILRNLGAMTGE